MPLRMKQSTYLFSSCFVAVRKIYVISPLRFIETIKLLLSGRGKPETVPEYVRSRIIHNRYRMHMIPVHM